MYINIQKMYVPQHSENVCTSTFRKCTNVCTSTIRKCMYMCLNNQKMYKCIYINIRWFGTATSSTNKTDCHDITEILSKIEFKIIIFSNALYAMMYFFTGQYMNSHAKILLFHQVHFLYYSYSP